MAREVTIDRNLVYLPKGREERLDVYYPAHPGPGERFPGVVVIHGGGWCTQSKDGEREQSIAGTIAAEGYVCVSIDYLLVDVDDPVTASRVWPTNVHDCKRAVGFLRGRADQYHIDPDHIAAIGGSAGGHLAALLACARSGSGLNPPGRVPEGYYDIQAAVSLYGVGDLRHWLQTADVSRLGIRAMSLMLGGSPEEAPAAYEAASPITYADADTPPILLIHGNADDTVPYGESEHFARELDRRGARNELVIVEGGVHSFNLQPPQMDLRPRVLGFLDVELKPTP